MRDSSSLAQIAKPVLVTSAGPSEPLLRQPIVDLEAARAIPSPPEVVEPPRHWCVAPTCRVLVAVGRLRQTARMPSTHQASSPEAAKAGSMLPTSIETQREQSTPTMSGARTFHDLVDNIVLGCWPLGGPGINLGTPMGWSNITDLDSEDVVEQALEAGVRRFDTADAYGLGRSELRLGRALARHKRDSFEITSKVGYLQPSDRSELWTAANLRAALEQTLQRLDTYYLDTYYLHHNSLSPRQLVSAAEALSQFRSEGLIRRIGIRGPHRYSLDRTLGTPTDKEAQFEAARAALGPGVLSVRANLLSPLETPLNVYNVARNQGLDVDIYKPLAQGLLTDKFIEGFPAFGDGDHRAKKAWFQASTHRVLRALWEEIRDLCPYSMLAVGLSWVHHYFPEANLIVGTQNARHLTQWLQTPVIQFTAEQLRGLDGAAERFRENAPRYMI